MGIAMKKLVSIILCCVMTFSCAFSTPLEAIAGQNYFNQENEISNTQRNSINMLNYLAVLTQEINDSKGKLN